MADDPKAIMAFIAKLRERAVTPEQAAYRREVDERNAHIQEGHARPVDGVTFGKQQKGKQ